MPFNTKRLEIPDVILIEPIIFKDERGFFIETYKKSDFEKFGIPFDLYQDNHSRSKKGVLRGLHYQLHPKAQGKLVRCIKGKIWDVAVDIRRGSPWFGKWVAAELSEDNHLMLWIPHGFAHGFVALDESEVFYKTTSEYASELDAGIRWNDPELSIAWPIEIPNLSRKDAELPFLRDAKNNFIYGENS